MYYSFKDFAALPSNFIFTISPEIHSRKSLVISTGYGTSSFNATFMQLFRTFTSKQFEILLLIPLKSLLFLNNDIHLSFLASALRGPGRIQKVCRFAIGLLVLGARPRGLLVIAIQECVLSVLDNIIYSHCVPHRHEKVLESALIFGLAKIFIAEGNGLSDCSQD